VNVVVEGVLTIVVFEFVVELLVVARLNEIISVLVFELENDEISVVTVLHFLYFWFSRSKFILIIQS
jgi:hypothetical protein